MADVINRDELERKYGREIARLFKGMSGHMLELLEQYNWDVNLIPANIWEGFTIQEKAVLLPFLENVSLASAERLVDSLPIGVDWGLVNQGAADWARSYSTLLAGQIDQSTREWIATSIRNSIASYFEEGLTMGDLIGRLEADPKLAKLFIGDVKDRLGRVYGPKRAEMIAVTEVTRAAVEGQRLVIRELNKQGVQMVPVWQTNNDALVCPLCGPRHDKVIEDGVYPPDPHPRCRCWINHEFADLRKQ